MPRMLSMLLSLTVLAAAGAPASFAQTRTESLDALRGELGRGDSISLIRDGGEALTGKLVRIGERDLVIRARVAAKGRREDLSVPLSTIQSLDRRGDSVRNGVLIGAGIGAGLFGTMFSYAVAVDRNEIDEWAPGYAAAGAVLIGAGAALGAMIDGLRSKPYVRFERSGARVRRMRIGPFLSPGKGIGIAASF